MPTRKKGAAASQIDATKEYDRAYYERWYRSSRRVVTPNATLRKARLALAAAEFMLGRDVKTVLDVGCGEGLWRRVLKRIRPTIDYTGIDSSEYVVQRFGKSRNIRPGTLGSLHRLNLRDKYDLIVCADVIAYVPTSELRRGLKAIRRRLGGVVYIDAYTIGDDFVGDLHAWHHRSANRYRQLFGEAGLVACGLNCFIARSEKYRMSELEICG